MTLPNSWEIRRFQLSLVSVHRLHSIHVFFHEYWSFEAAHQNNFYLKVDSNVYPNT